MKWRKLGLIYAPKGNLWWAKSYALLPTVDTLASGVVRVYFASLDENQYGRIGFVELKPDHPQHILFETEEPVLDLGELGTFDDCGVNPSCVIHMNGMTYLYYIGWQRGERTPYSLFTGLAVSSDGVRFRKSSRVPVLDRTDREPFLRSAPSIIQQNHVMRAWYVSGKGWTIVAGRQYPTYVIRTAESPDGVHWTSRDEVCIDFQDEDEFGFGRPWVIKDNDTYRMWYSIRSRSEPYRIGYAESTDGILWTRKDREAGIKRSASGWDSEMVCYPCVVDLGGKRYLFYNGNRHGSTGFGLAIQETA